MLVPGTDTTSDPGITNNVDTTPKKSKVSVVCTASIPQYYLNVHTSKNGRLKAFYQFCDVDNSRY